MTDTHDFDVLIVGAGLSGIGAACHLVREKTGKSFAILERRAAVGGTWDLFTYPGIRSDSDMLTFGFNFRPWNDTLVLADGPSIKQYVAETAEEYGVADHIRFGRRVVRASWSSAAGCWTVEVDSQQPGGARETYTSRFLIGATGYYNYDEGHRPVFPGEETFRAAGGQVVHPQFWPEDLDYAGKRIVIIGSGATAITLVPAMATGDGAAGHVTMLQRSPTYIMPVPETDPVASPLARLRVPPGVIYRSGRLRNIVLQQAVYKLCRAQPALARRVLLAAVRAQVGKHVDMRHFTPSYNPWDERLCVVPNGDLFRVLRRGEASIATDHIDTFTETGIRLRSGEELPADIVVSATGLQIQLAGGAELEVDGVPVETRERMLYKGVLMDGVPNSMFVIGYTNASWTLKADLASEYFCRLIKHMDAHGHDQVLPVADDADRSDVSVMGDSMRSGYIQRGDAVMPRQGKRMPWQIRNDYFRDAPVLRRGAIEDPVLRFSATPATVDEQTAAPAAAV
ncbi:NAD(P)/FAD-dependent oxidoreductase [Nocardioides immobilis]|uniref:FAD-containing monooxygenase EthA n=1 Tax=Nocardioides immobilis TaxID=2049295 RepID=A0A417Y3T3_9ACTN|nr:NAD(P)/FAD-dependent oxidoreductase [Nocardioides immobilis]RHW27310.1 NAD(P)/FAD-dependent oxidoreductase [Nocardioides immobilis]